MASKYEIGTRFEVSGQPVKADNGIFAISFTFMPQPNGDDYFHWRRITKSGQVSQSRSTNDLRSGRASWLDKHAKVIG